MNGPLNQREQYAKGGVGRWHWDKRDRRTFSYIREEKAILDVGCGEGISLEKLVKAFPGRRIVGIDPSPENVQVCQAHGLPVRQGDAYALAFENASFDCCVFMEVVEHLLEPEKALREIHRVLRPGGLLLVVFPNDAAMKAARLACLMFKEAFTPSGHVRQWTPAAMRRTLADTGFQVEAVESMPFYFWICSLHCLVAARKS